MSGLNNYKKILNYLIKYAILQDIDYILKMTLNKIS